MGRYIVERALGEGGMGVVVAARHEQLDELVAIKVLHPHASTDAVQVERFIREARATVRIKSEHVVRVLDAGAEESTGAPFIVMEYLEGRDIGQTLEAYGAIPLQLAVDYMIQICEAVAAAHALGIIHRDLKPSNFFLTARSDGSPHLKVLDFGISKAAQTNGKPDPRLTETQAVFGSPTYMSPEQIRSSKNVDVRSDVWSLGVALFEMLTAQLPFGGDSVAGLLAAVIADAPVPLSEFLPEVPPELEATVLACLEKSPARRISSVAELASRLAPFASEDASRLASRIDRASRGALGSTPSLAPLAAPSSPSLSRSSEAASAGASSSLSRLESSTARSSPRVSDLVPRTGTDMSATGVSLREANGRRPSQRRLAALGGAVGVLIALSALGFRLRFRDRATPLEAEASSLARASASVAPAAPVSPIASDSVDVPDAGPSHIVAPTASGKTLVVDRKSLPGSVKALPRGAATPLVPSRASATTAASSATPSAPTSSSSPPSGTQPSTNLDSRF